MSYEIKTLDEHFTSAGPKRILALDGGGLRGIVTLGYLSRIESLLRERHGDSADFRLGHYFDLIAGTSTGAIIAASLAKGMSVTELTDMYMQLGEDVFRRSRWRKGILRARYDAENLTRQLKRVLGARTTLGSAELITGLLIMTKRMDTGSSWPLGNNPAGQYYRSKGGYIANRDYPLWKVVRASTAAPSYFDPERITISRVKGKKAVVGDFVDGGVSPFNNPTLQAFMYATLDGFRVRWPAGARRLLIVSVGTGRGHPGKDPTWITAKGAMQSLLSLMDDSGALVETMAQWLSTGLTHREIDSEIGSLTGDQIGRGPQFTYARFDLSLEKRNVDSLRRGVSDEVLESLTEMDEPDNMPLLKELAEIDSSRIGDEHFPGVFDLA